MIVRILIAVLLFCGTVQAEVSNLDFALWENRLFKSTPRSVDKIVYEMNQKLPKEQPWPERGKALLLDIINKHYANGKYREVCCEDPNFEWSLDPVRIVAFQDDVRFLPYLIENIGGSNYTIIGLTRLGEVALPGVIKKMYVEGFSGIQMDAVRTLERMQEQKAPFLQKGNNPELIKHGLVFVAQTSDHFAARHAIQALGTLGDPSTVPVLHTIGRNDTRPMIREMALNAIQNIKHQSVIRSR